MATLQEVSLPNDALWNLFFGKDDAESDSAAGGLLRQGFLQTAAYEAALRGRKSLIIGRKGSGKSAICLMLKAKSDDGECVSLVTPDEISADEIRRFELAGITPEQSKVLVWRYVFAVQIAKYVLALSRCYFDTDAKLPEEIRAIRRFLIDNGEVDDLKIHEKFWRVLERIKVSISLEAFGTKLVTEMAPSPGIRANSQLDEIEKQIKIALEILPNKSKRPKLLLLVDQIEKVWSNDRNSDLMVIGLLLASKHTSNAFQRKDDKGKDIKDVNCIVFLRLDIYDLLSFQNRDYFRGEEMHIAWDVNALVNLVVARAEASIGVKLPSDSLWKNLFPKKVNDKTITDFIVQHTLMRPREIIQLCNACVDAAQKNGHNCIEEEDVHEAVRLYSNWKVSDLVNEYQINYPFLSRLFVLFTNTSFLVSRNIFDQKLSKLIDALSNQYKEFSHVFSLDSILSILYSIGFLGVIRNEQTTFVYNDPGTIEYYETQFVIHPAFREALRSTSSVDLIQYEPTLFDASLSRIQSEISGGFSSRRGSIKGVRGGSAYRLVNYVQEMCERIEMATVTSGLPEEVRAEVRRNLRSVNADAEKALNVDNSEITIHDLPQRSLKFFSNLKLKLRDSQLLDDDRNTELSYALESAIEELQRGLIYGESLEA
jgi:hypothetical protein